MSSSPSWSSINRRMRNLDLKLKSENDSNQRCSFDTLILDEEPSLTAKPIATTTASTTTKNVISSTSESSNIGDDSEQSHEIIGVNYDPTFDFCSFESDQCREALVHHQHHHYPSDTTTDYFTENPSISSQESITTQSMIEESSELSVIVPIATSPTTKTTTGNTSGHVAAPLRPTNLPIGPRSAAIKHSQEVSRTLSATGSSNANRSAFARSNFKEPKSAPTPTSSNPLSFTLNQSLRSTYSSFIDRISARINGSFNFGSRPLNSATAPTSSSAASTTGTNYQHLPVFGQGSDPTGRPMTLRSNSAKSNGSTDVPQIDHPPLSASAENAQVGGSPLSLSVNAQCLSPRPRPKALPISFGNARNQSPSRSPKPLQPLIFSPNNSRLPRADSGNILKKDNNTTLRDKFRLNNNVLTIGQKKYVCQESDFRYIEELGSGSCGHVAKMEHTLSKSVIAVKQMRRSGDDEESKRIIMDLDVLLKCYHCEHIVQCYGYLIKDTEVWICMELMATCFDKLLRRLGRPFPEPICGKIAVASVKALNYLKDEHSVIHRDVKPSNILINHKGIVKLCDFGISGRLVNSKAKTRQAGCAAYMAPERIDPPDPSKPSYDIRADVWSLGISLVELAIGRFPYPECKTDFEVLSKIIQNEPPFLPDDGTFSPDFCSFIKACLQKDYSKRLKYHQLLCHPFILKYEREHVDMEKWFWESISNKH